MSSSHDGLPAELPTSSASERIIADDLKEAGWSWPGPASSKSRSRSVSTSRTSPYDKSDRSRGANKSRPADLEIEKEVRGQNVLPPLRRGPRKPAGSLGPLLVTATKT